ncbi:TPA: hypothetical protein ACIRVE_005069 [Pseudomonas putida]
MTKETTMTIRIEPDLKDDFQTATKANHKPAAQILRDFMREYVAAHKNSSGAIPQHASNEAANVAE